MGIMAIRKIHENAIKEQLEPRITHIDFEDNYTCDFCAGEKPTFTLLVEGEDRIRICRACVKALAK